MKSKLVYINQFDIYNKKIKKHILKKSKKISTYFKILSYNEK